MKKKFLAIVLCGAMVLSFTACKKNDSSNDTTQGTTVEGSTEAAQAEPVKQTMGVTDYSSYVKLGAYTGLSIEVDAAVVTDEQIEEYKAQVVDYYNNYMAEGEHITEGITADGDNINLDFSGLLNGEAFDGGTATGQSYTVGSGAFISSLDEQLAGLEVGKEYELPCVFPEDYSVNPDLAGKEVVFVVTVNYIEGEKPVYEWGDELVNLYTEGEFTSADEFLNDAREQMVASTEAAQQNEYQTALWDKIFEGCEFTSLPEEKVESIYENYLSYFSYNATMYQTDVETYISVVYGMTMEEFENECRIMAEEEVKYMITGCEIYKALGYTMTDEVYNQKAQETAAQYGYESAQAFIDEYGEEYVKEGFIFEIVSEYIAENNKMIITE